mmetsp:Transcript_158566/g.504587  ORF Transcript_158566/g.504587 Transcript_158566/m.504587 type:complete len:216 (+) Transcript_158566:928-1575(+)
MRDPAPREATFAGRCLCRDRNRFPRQSRLARAGLGQAALAPPTWHRPARPTSSPSASRHPPSPATEPTAEDLAPLLASSAGPQSGPRAADPMVSVHSSARRHSPRTRARAEAMWCRTWGGRAQTLALGGSCPPAWAHIGFSPHGSRTPPASRERGVLPHPRPPNSPSTVSRTSSGRSCARQSIPRAAPGHHNCRRSGHCPCLQWRARADCRLPRQ